MSAVRDLTDALIAGGMHPADAAAMVVRAGAELTVAAPSKGAVRTRNWRARQASQSVTGDAPVTPEPNVTKRHESSQSVTSDAASLSTLLTDDEKKHSEKKEKREANRATQITAGWRPDAESWNDAVAVLGAERAEYELKKFHDHALEKGRVAKNWNAAWRNWAKRAVEFGGRNGNGSGGNRANQTSGQSGSAAIMAGVAAAAERRGRERSAGGPPGRQPPRGDDVAREPDFEFGGTADG